MTAGKNTFFIYPNPTESTAIIRIESLKKDPVKIKLENSIGQLISENSIQLKPGLNFFPLGIEKLSPGVYFISFETAAGRFTRKLVKE